MSSSPSRRYPSLVAVIWSVIGRSPPPANSGISATRVRRPVELGSRPHAPSSRRRPNAVRARAEPCPPRSTGSPGETRHEHPPGDRTRRGPPDAVRTRGVHRSSDPAGRLPSRRPHAGAPAEDGRAGLDDADHDPHGVPAGLLALRRRDPRAPASRLGPGLPPFGERGGRRCKEDRAVPRRRTETSRRDRRVARLRHPHVVRRRALARSRPCTALRDLGAAEGRPVRARVGLARGAAGDHRGGGDRPPRQALPRRVRTGVPGGRRQLHGHPGSGIGPGVRAAHAPALPRRGRRGAARCAARTAPRCRHARPRALPPRVGCHAAGPCPPHADPPGAPPGAGVQHEDPAVDPHVPRRRAGRGQLAHRSGRVVLDPFERLSAEARRAAKEEAASLEELFAARP